MELLIRDVLPLLAINFALAMGFVLILWALGNAIRDVSIIDMFFGVLFFLIAATSYQLGGGAEQRKLLLLGLVGVWCLRITVHLIRRNWGHGEDARYTKLRGWVKDDRAFVWLSLRKVFLYQGAMLWVASLPVQVAMVYPQTSELGWLAWLGTALWALGLVVESVADIQLTRFRADPAKRGTVLNTGVWRYSRHPNYFGELCVWWGVFLVACAHPLGWLTIIGPLTYSHMLINVTGQRTLEKKLAREKPGYRQYMETTSALIPLPPRKKRTST